jgi:Tfp pilus assembly protein PilZ
MAGEDDSANAKPGGGPPAGGSDDSNRRRAERVPVNAAFSELGDVTYVSDLSEHGVFVHTDDLLAVGDEIELRFTVVLDDPVVFLGRGRVVRHQQDPKGMGIEFLELSPETMLRLGDVVARSRPQELGTPLPPPSDASDEDDSAQTVIRRRPPELLRARVEVETVDEDDLESSKTLVALRPVGLEIAEDEGPEDPDRRLDEENDG